MEGWVQSLPNPAELEAKENDIIIDYRSGKSSRNDNCGINDGAVSDLETLIDELSGDKFNLNHDSIQQVIEDLLYSKNIDRKFQCLQTIRRSLTFNQAGCDSAECEGKSNEHIRDRNVMYEITLKDIFDNDIDLLAVQLLYIDNQLLSESILANDKDKKNFLDIQNFINSKNNQSILLETNLNSTKIIVEALFLLYRIAHSGLSNRVGKKCGREDSFSNTLPNNNNQRLCFGDLSFGYNVEQRLLDSRLIYHIAILVYRFLVDHYKKNGLTESLELLTNSNKSYSVEEGGDYLFCNNVTILPPGVFSGRFRLKEIFLDNEIQAKRSIEIKHDIRRPLFGLLRILLSVSEETKKKIINTSVKIPFYQSKPSVFSTGSFHIGSHEKIISFSILVLRMVNIKIDLLGVKCLAGFVTTSTGITTFSFSKGAFIPAFFNNDFCILVTYFSLLVRPFIDCDILNVCTSTLLSICDKPAGIQCIIDNPANLLESLVKILLHPSDTVTFEALSIIAKIAFAGTTQQIEALIKYDAVRYLVQLLEEKRFDGKYFEGRRGTILLMPDPLTEEQSINITERKFVSSATRARACNCLGNIGCETSRQVQCLIDCDAFPFLVNIFKMDPDYNTRIEAAYAVCAAVSKADSSHIRYIVSCTNPPIITAPSQISSFNRWYSSSNCMGLISDMLELVKETDPMNTGSLKLCKAILRGLENILSNGVTEGNAIGLWENPYVLLFKECNGDSKLREMLYYPDFQVVTKTQAIINQFLD